MSVVFFVPMFFIALYESSIKSNKNKWLNSWLRGRDQGYDDDIPTNRDPETDGQDAANGLQISKVPFKELIEVFPNTYQSSEATILQEVKSLKKQIEALTKLVEKLDK